MKLRLGSLRNLALGGLLSGAILAVSPVASAQAALINTDPCDNATLTQPFLKWGDSNFYKMVPGGSFETGTSGWTLSGGARLVSGSEPYGVTGSVGKYSVYIPAGGSVQSPFTCVDFAYPTFRFFALNRGLLSTLLASVVYNTPLGQVTVPVGAALLSGNWNPNTLPMLTLSAVPALLSNGTAQVSLRFTELLGASQVDDVYVDPRMK